jgi:hypothetical protein
VPTTFTGNVAVTSGCSLTCTLYEPVVLIGPVSSRRRRSSTGPPAALTASTISAGVIDPNERPSLPTARSA